MYVPKHFEETRAETLHELIRSYPLGALVASTPDGLEASHIPFEIDPEVGPHGLLRCHVARANPVWRVLEPDREVLVLFQGAQSYVSPSAYAAKQEHGKVVPTWNYAVVHAYGRPSVTHDAQWLRKMVEDLTTRHEAGRVDPWKVSDAPADYVDKLLQAIVGIEIPITRLLGKWKVSQNRSTADRQGVMGALAASTASPEREMADLIGRTL